MQAPPSGPAPIPQRLFGKRFGAEQLGVIREQMGLAQPAHRSEIARRVCVALQWRSPGGAYQLMSARVALLRLHRLGLIALPPPRSRRNNENRRLGTAPPEPLATARISCPAGHVAGG